MFKSRGRDEGIGRTKRIGERPVRRNMREILDQLSYVELLKDYSSPWNDLHISESITVVFILILLLPFYHTKRVINLSN
jgi:hypothetical protein